MRIGRILPSLLVTYFLLAFLIGLLLNWRFALEYLVGFSIATLAVFAFTAISFFVIWKPIQLASNEQLLFRRGGRLIDTGLRGGLALVVRLTDQPDIVSLGMREFKLAGIQCLTKDAGTLSIDCTAMWQVTNPVQYAAASGDPKRLIETIATLDLQKQVSAMSISDFIASRATAADNLRSALRHDPMLLSWGVIVTGFWITDLKIPQAVQEILLRRLAADLMGPVISLEGTNAANALNDMKAIVGNDAILLELLRTLNVTFGKK